MRDYKNKSCIACQLVFKPYSGSHKFCSAKCKDRWKYVDGTYSTEEQYKRINGNWNMYFSRLVHAGSRRHSLTKEVLLQVLQEQDYKCALTGVELTCHLEKGTISKTNASIDRIIAGGAYTKENIQ